MTNFVFSDSYFVFLKIFTVVFGLLLYRYSCTIRILSKFKPKIVDKKNGIETRMPLDAKDIQQLLKDISVKEPNVVGIVKKVVFMDRPKTKKGSLDLILAQVKTNRNLLGEAKAVIMIYPFFYDTKKDEYFLKGYSEKDLMKATWSSQEIKKTQEFSFVHELGHLRLWLSGFFDTGNAVEDACDEFARRMLDMEKPYYDMRKVPESRIGSV